VRIALVDVPQDLRQALRPSMSVLSTIPRSSRRGGQIMTAATVPALREEWSSLRTLVGIGAVLLGTFTSILNARLTDIGLGDISGALGLSLDEASWITTAYGVAEVAAIPAAVRLRGILSPTRGVIRGAALFSVFPLAAPFSPDLSILLSLQALRGLSAGVLIPMAYAVIMRHLPQHQRLYRLSFYALVSATTPASRFPSKPSFSNISPGSSCSGSTSSRAR
jgi:DHA2 family multidrug resistance protein